MLMDGGFQNAQKEHSWENTGSPRCKGGSIFRGVKGRLEWVGSPACPMSLQRIPSIMPCWYLGDLLGTRGFVT